MFLYAKFFIGKSLLRCGSIYSRRFIQFYIPVSCSLYVYTFDYRLHVEDVCACVPSVVAAYDVSRDKLR